MTEAFDSPLAPLEITVDNFRGVRHARFQPESVSALVGPNGSGKSSLLAAYLFMHDALKKSIRDANAASGEYGSLRHFDAVGQPVVVALADRHVSWRLELIVDGNARLATFSETLRYNDVEIDLSLASGRQPLANESSETRLAAVFNVPDEAQRAIERFRERVRGISVFPTWQIGAFRREAWSGAHDTSDRLRHDGGNIAAVLKTWDEREHREKLQWVRSAIKRVHGAMIDDIDVKQESTTKYVRCFPSASERWLPLNAMSSGFISTLFTLTAVAGAPRGATLLFDEADNSLHPAAIRLLLDAVRERAAERELTVVFATHSTVMLDTFNDEPESVWVSGRERGVEPLTKQLDADWLRTFKLGAIYGSAFGRQAPLRVSEPHSSDAHPDPNGRDEP